MEMVVAIRKTYKPRACVLVTKSQDMQEKFAGVINKLYMHDRLTNDLMRRFLLWANYTENSMILLIEGLISDCDHELYNEMTSRIPSLILQGMRGFT